MSTENLLTLFRGSERLLILAFSGMAIYWGYRLFSLALPTDGELAAKGGNFQLKLTRVAPGTLFALFGIASFAFALRAQLDFNVRHTRAGGELEGISARYATGGVESDRKMENLRHLQAINFVTAKCLAQLEQEHDAKSQRTRSELEELKTDLVRRIEGEQNLKRFLALRAQVTADSTAVNKFTGDERNVYERISSLFTFTY